MLLDRGGDADVLALRFRIVAAHQPLQFRELSHHFGHEIGLRESRGALRELRHAADRRRQRARQGGDALDALALRPQLLMKYDAERLQLLEPLIQRLLGLVLIIRQRRQIRPPEMPRIRQPRAHDARIARCDRRAAVARDEVRDEDEFVASRASERGIATVPSPSWPGLSRPSTSIGRIPLSGSAPSGAAWMAGTSPAMTDGAPRRTKHFWLARIVARITSGGSSRNSGSNSPISTTGHSTRPATSSS